VVAEMMNKDIPRKKKKRSLNRPNEEIPKTLWNYRRRNSRPPSVSEKVKITRPIECNNINCEYANLIVNDDKEGEKVF